ncbi:MAG: hypothetical protein RRZ24_09950 [Clostridia bacterium]
MEQHRAWNTLCHANIILSSLFIVFFCIDRVNPAMNFLGCAMSKWLLLVFALCALLCGVRTAVYLYRKNVRAAEREYRHAQHGKA